MSRSIYEDYFKNELLNRFHLNGEHLLDENNYLLTIRQINREYDEIVLTNCIIDERIFLENKTELNDLLNSLNENRNCKSSTHKTPLTANQHLTFVNQQTNPSLTPISQSNHLIEILFSIIEQQQTNPHEILLTFIGEQHFLGNNIKYFNIKLISYFR